MTKGERVVRELRRRIPLLKFHSDWLKQALAPDVQVAALSVPRGNAKSYLLGHLAAQTLNPDSCLYEAGVEHVIVAGSREQARILLGFLKEGLDQVGSLKGYHITDSPHRCWVRDKSTGAGVRVIASSGKRAMGLVNFKFLFADEPASWAVREGALLYEALRTSLGKQPEQRLLLIGTKSPAEVDSWWPQLLEAGSGAGTHVTVLSADPDAPWDAYQTIAKVNPLIRHNPDLRKTVLRERNEARRNPHLRATFEAYRLNRHVVSETAPLIQVEDWKKVEARPVPPRVGQPIVGIDLGSSRSWSAAWALWQNGRSEAYALCPGIPDLAARERQDHVPRGLYKRLHEDGVLITEQDKRLAQPATLLGHLERQGIEPDTVYCDRFLLPQLMDVVAGRFPVIARTARWSQATEDVTGFRKLALDGPLAIAPESRALVRLSLSKAVLRSDEQGSVFLKKSRGVAARDDVAVAGTLVCGALARIRDREHGDAAADSVRPVHRVCKVAA